MFRAYLVKLCLILAFLAAAPMAYAQDDPERYVDVRLIAEKNKIVAGDTVIIAIEETIHPGWHTYWINPGDSGEPTSIEWTLPDGFEINPIKWPVPEKIEIGPLVNYGYENKVTLLQELYVPYGLPDGPITLTAEVNLLVCEEICIPESSTHSLTFNGGAEAVTKTALIDEAYKHLPIESDWRIMFSEEDGRFTLSVEPAFPAVLKTIQKDTIDLIPADWGIVDYTDSASASIGERVLRVSKKRSDRPLAALDKIAGIITYTNSNGQETALAFTALPDPEWQENMAAAPAKPPKEPDIQKKPGPSVPAAAKTGIQDITFFTAIMFALFGGLILNLMPCVFPILSMKALSLCQMKEQELKTARMHGLLYTGGVVLTFIFIAGLLLALRAGGSSLGWGFQLQNPMVVLVLAWLFFVITLNLAGFFTINILIGKAGTILTKHHGYTGSFLTGVLATIVATPCTAPFMGAAMGFAIVQPATVGMSIFIALGLGLALPYLALSFFPALQRILPRPGPWMERFRHILAVPMGLSVIWLVWVYNQQTGALSIPVALSGMVALTVAIWIVKSSQDQKNGNTMAAILAILIAVTTFKAGYQYSAQPYKPPMPPPISPEETHIYTPETLQTLLAGNEPVFVNMTAAWCITCKVNEKAVLAKKETEKLFMDNNVHYLIGDWTNQNAAITDYLAEFDRNGVPLYVFYGKRLEETGKRPDPAILPQILTPTILKNTIKGKEND